MSLPDATPAPGGLSRGLVTACGVFVVTSAWAFAASQDNSTIPPSFVLLMCWPVFALTAGVLLDRTPPERPLALASLGLAAVAPAGATWVRATTGAPLGPDLLDVVRPAVPVLVVAVSFALSWGLRPRAADPAFWPWLLGALAGAVLAGPLDRPVLGWGVVALSWAGHGVATTVRDHDRPRQARRRHGWTLAVTTLTWVTVAVAQALLSDPVADTVSGLGVVGLALVVTRLAFLDELRPARDLLLDLGVVLGTASAALVVAAAVRLGVERTPLRSPGTFAAFAGLVTLVLVVPAALQVRRGLLARRYGSGSLSPADVALLTADLHARTDPRDLLDNAARMVAASSGARSVRLLLGPVDEPVGELWTEHPLVVGGDLVGTMLVETTSAGGPEPVQRRVVEQLLPTVALVARAVGLAVEAEHARSDVARERDAERRRMLADLHDGLGPALAGMSMRVQAAVRRGQDAEPLLVDLADDLATCRTDLRRIVSDLTPSVLDGGDLERALTLLVRSFGDLGPSTGPPTGPAAGSASGPAVTLRVDLDADRAAALATPVQVTLYRCVAEGVTNALRHGSPSRIDVHVSAEDGHVVAEVRDDGSGGPVVPGVGLSSLRQRAEAVGGRLDLAVAPRGGTVLRLLLPADATVPA